MTKTVFEEVQALYALKRRHRLRHIAGAQDWMDRHGVDPGVAKAMLEISPKPAQPGPGDIVIAMLYRGKLRFADNRTVPCHDCGAVLEVQGDLPFYAIKLCVFCATARDDRQ